MPGKISSSSKVPSLKVKARGDAINKVTVSVSETSMDIADPQIVLQEPEEPTSGKRKSYDDEEDDFKLVKISLTFKIKRPESSTPLSKTPEAKRQKVDCTVPKSLHDTSEAVPLADLRGPRTLESVYDDVNARASAIRMNTPYTGRVCF